MEQHEFSLDLKSHAFPASYAWALAWYLLSSQTLSLLFFSFFLPPKFNLCGWVLVSSFLCGHQPWACGEVTSIHLHSQTSSYQPLLGFSRSLPCLDECLTSGQSPASTNWSYPVSIMRIATHKGLTLGQVLRYKLSVHILSFTPHRNPKSWEFLAHFVHKETQRVFKNLSMFALFVSKVLCWALCCFVL